MIKALAHDQEGKPVVFLGVDEKGVELLKQGLPIKIDFNEIDPGLFDCTTIIFYGKDAEELKDIMLGKNRDAEVKKERHDAPLSVRAEFMKRVEALIQDLSHGAQPAELTARMDSVKESLELMKRTSP